MNMSEEVITPQQLANNIKNKTRYVPTNEAFEHADFIKSINKILDEYIFEDDSISKERKQKVFLNFNELSFPVDMLNTIYLQPAEDLYYQKIETNYAADIRNSGWNISYVKDVTAIRPRYLVKLKADTPIEK